MVDWCTGRYLLESVGVSIGFLSGCCIVGVVGNPVYEDSPLIKFGGLVGQSDVKSLPAQLFSNQLRQGKNRIWNVTKIQVETQMYLRIKSAMERL